MSEFNLRRVFVSSPGADCLTVFLLVVLMGITVRAQSTSNIICRPEFSTAHKRQLAEHLREITGWRALDFEESGLLATGPASISGGSPTARALFRRASEGSAVVVLEDASDQAEVVFSRVIAGRWTTEAEKKPTAFIVQVDFIDFSRLLGDRDAKAAFNPGWALLHEISHAVDDTVDPRAAGDVGKCEALINTMRRELGLAERAEYHFHFLPGLNHREFKTRMVRLAFERYEPVTNRRRRLWLVWDAALVGGLGRSTH